MNLTPRATTPRMNTSLSTILPYSPRQHKRQRRRTRSLRQPAEQRIRRRKIQLLRSLYRPGIICRRKIPRSRLTVSLYTELRRDSLILSSPVSHSSRPTVSRIRSLSRGISSPLRAIRVSLRVISSRLQTLTGSRRRAISSSRIRVSRMLRLRVSRLILMLSRRRVTITTLLFPYRKSPRLPPAPRCSSSYSVPFWSL